MKILVTAGPAYEPLDAVRRLANFSTGRLGSELANHLSAVGHEVTLLLGQMSTWHGRPQVSRLLQFDTGANLGEHFRRLSTEPVDAIFHAAAVSDFGFGRIYRREADGSLVEVVAGKVPTNLSGLMVELRATPKLIAGLRDLYPAARIAGWKYAVDGGRSEVVASALEQIRGCRTDLCVANGPAYGDGFGIVFRNGDVRHCPDRTALFYALSDWLNT